MKSGVRGWMKTSHDREKGPVRLILKGVHLAALLVVAVLSTAAIIAVVCAVVAAVNGNYGF